MLHKRPELVELETFPSVLQVVLNPKMSHDRLLSYILMKLGVMMRLTAVFPST